MKVDIHDRFESRLPTEDEHPYRTGAWRPQTVEYDAWELDVEGEIPRDLCGVYLRNTENPLLPPIQRYHPFDGDGMLHSISFDRTARPCYHNRFVRTDGFLAERDAGEHLVVGRPGRESPEARQACVQTAGGAPRPNMKDASSTDVVVHNAEGASRASGMCGDLYRFDPWTHGGGGQGASFGGRVSRRRGCLPTPRSTRTRARCSSSTTGKKRRPICTTAWSTGRASSSTTSTIPLPGPATPPRHGLHRELRHRERLSRCSGIRSSWRRTSHYVPRFYPETSHPLRHHPAPGRKRRRDPLVRCGEPTYVLHWINAYEDGDEVVLDGFFQANPSPEVRPELGIERNLFRYLDLHEMKSYAHRWRLRHERPVPARKNACPT